jgi:hypothetical protein
MPSLSRSFDLYWDLDDIITQAVDGNGIYSEPDNNVRRAFGKAKVKHVKYMKKLDRNPMIYAAHCLNPRHRTSSIKTIMPDKADDIITSIKKYFKREWPDVVTTTSPGLISASDADSRPDGLSIAQWKAIQQRREREREVSATLATANSIAGYSHFQLKPTNQRPRILNQNTPNLIRLIQVWFEKFEKFGFKSQP